MDLKKLFVLTIAILVINKALAQSSDDAQIQKSNEAGNLCLQANNLMDQNPEQALILYKKASLLDPNGNSANVHTNYGTLLQNMGRIEAAIEEYKKAAQFNPGSIQINHGLASALLAKALQLRNEKRYEEAKLLYEEAQTLKPIYPSDLAAVHTSFGILYRKMGNLEATAEQYKMALEIDPMNRESIYNIGCYYELTGDIEQAIKYFTKFVSVFPNDPNKQIVIATLDSLKHKKPLIDTDKQSSEYVRDVTADGIQLWPKKTMPVKVFIPAITNIPGFQKSLTEILKSSFDDWIKSADNYLSWQLIANENDADIVCIWTIDTKDFKYHSAEQGETHREYIPSKTGPQKLVHARITLCIVNSTSGELLTEKEIKNLCLHEIGHALGLLGHSPNNNDAMFYATGNVRPICNLSNRDVSTINELYKRYQASLD